ncbi:MAG: hypothetical protein PHU21_02025, partial [Elusimicrobia bacterium]|nr:hypothetical protein [Elusimicrobiota bacterium]
MQDQSEIPLKYTMSRAASHHITIIGEGHRIQQDAALISALVPLLQDADIDMAVEVFPASEQARISALITAPNWSLETANSIMRSAEWPYEGYRDILHAAWAANRKAARSIAIVAIGPGSDWRDTLLPKGISYDGFMADLVSKHLAQSRRGIVVYCGMHHAFTRYHQAELDDSGRATSYMDRMGNILWRRYGQAVFLIALHKPIWCGDWRETSYCLPLGGRLDCAATKVGHPIGFDILGTPMADLSFGATEYYSYGHPTVRLADYADGYVWSGPVESYRHVAIIPLDQYAPSPEALDEVARENPFNDEKGVSIKRLRTIWSQELEASRDIAAKVGWKHLAAWQAACSR